MPDTLIIISFANQGIDFHGGGARNGSTSCFTTSISKQTEKSHIKSTHIPSLDLSLSVAVHNFRHNARITEITFFIDAKSDPD